MNDLWRALRYLWKYWGTTLGAFLSLLIVTATNLFSPQLLRLVIDQGISAQNLSVILLTSLGLLGVGVVAYEELPAHRLILGRQAVERGNLVVAAVRAARLLDPPGEHHDERERQRRRKRRRARPVQPGARRRP